MLLGCAVTAGVQARRLAAELRGFFRQHPWSRIEGLRPMFLLGVVAGLALSLPSALRRESGFRLLWDETVVHSTSLSMQRNRSAEMPMMALPKADGLEPVATAVDKRPPLFPFLVSLLHGARGPREENGQLLNKGLRQALLLFTAVAFVLGGVPLPAAAAALTLLMALPILAWASSSGGIDLLAACAVLWFLRLFAQAWEKKDLAGFLLCLAPAAAAAYSRYEVIAIVLPALALLLWRLKRKFLAEAAAALACLLVLLAPLVALLLEARASFVEAGGGPLFSLSNVPINANGYFEELVLGNWHDPFLAWACLAMLALLAGTAWFRKPGVFAAALGAASLFQLTLVLLYFAGHPFHVASARLYLLPVLALMLAPGALGIPEHRKGKGWNARSAAARLGPWCVLAVALAVKLLAHAPAPAELFPPTPEQRVKAALDPRLPELGKLRAGVIVSNLHFYLVGKGLPSVSPQYFLERHREIAGPVHWLRTPVDDPYGISAEATAALEKARWLPVPAAPPEVNLYRLVR